MSSIYVTLGARTSSATTLAASSSGSSKTPARYGWVEFFCCHSCQKPWHFFAGSTAVELCLAQYKSQCPSRWCRTRTPPSVLVPHDPTSVSRELLWSSLTRNSARCKGTSSHTSSRPFHRATQSDPTGVHLPYRETHRRLRVYYPAFQVGTALSFVRSVSVVLHSSDVSTRARLVSSPKSRKWG